MPNRSGHACIAVCPLLAWGAHFATANFLRSLSWAHNATRTGDQGFALQKIGSIALQFPLTGLRFVTAYCSKLSTQLEGAAGEQGAGQMTPSWRPRSFSQTASWRCPRPTRSTLRGCWQTLSSTPSRSSCFPSCSSVLFSTRGSAIRPSDSTRLSPPLARRARGATRTRGS